MAKFVHVEVARVRSGMRKIEALLAGDESWRAEIQLLDQEAEFIRVEREREHVLRIDATGPARTVDRLIRPHDAPGE